MRVSQTSTFMLSLVREVGAGRMLPAAMQRPYVWLKQDVEALCDSVLCGFPVGSFMAWAPGAKADLTKVAKPRLGPVVPGEATQADPYQLLLDGQNRLATLAWMMTKVGQADVSDPSPEEQATWLSGERLVLDNATRSMFFVPAAQADDGLRLPSWTVLADSQLSTFQEGMRLVRNSNDRWLQTHSQEQINEFLTLWDHARDMFREARTTMTLIEDATVEEARHAFLRICRVGVQMSAEDFDRATTWG